ncbi:MAG: NAD(P)H-binding protein [Deltaproteobacteria bacterium]|jgi:uncharacterized protein YbjT (DUF2867 family)|nr:NAD(P)H-binding protein [Deltaproteobacteria bacterium]MBW2535171.1 NAD(P)H-binding protein [Deltaproteobacteria bacterium]
MKILVMGATGRTGRLLVDEAVRRGHSVVAIARDEAKLAGSGAEVVVGSPYDATVVDRAMAGCDAVVNTLNVSRASDNPWAPLRAPKDLISTAAQNALAVMDRHDVRRFVALSTYGAGTSKKRAPLVLRLIVGLSNLKYAFADHGAQEELLRASGIDYTVARAPMLTDGAEEPLKGLAEGANERPVSKISRRSVARYFVDILEKGEHLREVIGLSR